jgi:predicted PurR-regulated permease PerM
MKLSRYFSFIVLVAVVALLAVLFYKVMVNFFVPLFLAVLVVVIFRPLHRWILEKVEGKKNLAAFLSTITIFLAVLIPVGLLITFAVIEGRTATRRFQMENVANELTVFRRSLGLEIPAITELRAVETAVEAITPAAIEGGDLASRRKLIEQARTTLLALAKQTGLPEKFDTRPQATDFFRTPSPRESWHRFLYEFENLSSRILREPKQPLPAESGEPPAEQTFGNEPGNGVREPVAAQDGELTLAQQIRKNLAALDEFKAAYCGGKTWYWIKQIANPNEQELAEYNSTATQFVKEQLLSLGGSITSFLLKLIIGLVIMMVAVYFFLLDGPRMIEALKSMSPISDSHEEELVQEFMRVSRAVVLATLLSAIAQGVLAGIGFFACGLGNSFLLTLLTTCFGLIPIFGAWLVWLPASLWLLLFEHESGKAIGLALYGAIIVSQIDNLIKPYILHGHSNLHPLFALLSVLGGVIALGPIGILIGPMIVVFLQTLLNILQRELRTMDTSVTPATADAGDGSLLLPIEGEGPESTQSQARPSQKPKKGGKK